MPMKKTLICLMLLLFLYSYSKGQTATELFNSQKYQELIKLESKANTLTPIELYMLGFAFFQSENDTKAIEFYDKAISKGYNEACVYYYKGLALRYSHKYDEALQEVTKSIEKDPNNQEYRNEKGLILYNQGQQDKALAVFQEAKKLTNTIGEPYFWVAHIYHEQQNYQKALSLYYEAVDSIPKSNSYYCKTLQAIGQLEYTFTKDYRKSINAYTEVLKITPKDYKYYTKLIKALNAGKEYAKADSVFDLLKIAYNNKELSEDDMKFRNIPIDEYEWNGQIMTVYKQLVDPQKSLDLSYKIYLISKDGKKVERTFMVEKTIQIAAGVKHLLCERKKEGSHITYPLGWSTDTIPLIDIKKAVNLVLEGKIEQGASSKTGN